MWIRITAGTPGDHTHGGPQRVLWMADWGDFEDLWHCRGFGESAGAAVRDLSRKMIARENEENTRLVEFFDVEADNTTVVIIDGEYAGKIQQQRNSSWRWDGCAHSIGSQDRRNAQEAVQRHLASYGGCPSGSVCA